MSLKIIRNIFILLTLLVLSFGVGYSLGVKGVNITTNGISSLEITSKTSSKYSSVDFSLFWDVWDRLNRYYIDKKAVDAEKMVFGAISGMVSSLGDPYTVFLPPDQNKDAKDDLGGRFEGIGAQLGVKEKKIVVVAPLKGAPAESAGLKAGDWIIKVDNQETASWTLPYAVSKIRGEKGSKVVLTVLHKAAEKTEDITVTRDSIKVASVEWEVKNIKYQKSNIKYEISKDECSECEKIIYLKLSRFGDDTTNEWNKAVDAINETMKQWSNGTIKGLVFDLRNNPGGYLSGSVFIASEFLSDGIIVIQENTGGRETVYKVNRTGKLLTIPIVVLINKGSASASEIVAGALRDRNRATLVGETSFGKGSIQEAQELANGSGIHITTAKWLLPSRKWINGTGLEPDIKQENDDKQPGTDLQLEKAIEILLK